MLQAMIDDGEGGLVTLRSLAKTFLRQEYESRDTGAHPLPLNLSLVRIIQSVGVMNVAQTGGTLTKEVLEAVFAEERLPDVILDKPETRTLSNLLGLARGMMRYAIFGP